MKPKRLLASATALAVTLPACIALASDEAAPSVFHGQLKVIQLGPENTPEAVDVSIALQLGPGVLVAADRGDFEVSFGFENDFAAGVTLSAVRQNGRNNGAGGDTDITVFSTSAASPSAAGNVLFSAYSVANLGGTFYADYDGGTGASFDGGVTGAGFVHTARPVAGYRPVNLGETYTANVTALLRDWTAGEPNHGLVILSQRVGQGNSHTADGWQICSSSHGNVSNRPKLKVDFLPPGTGPVSEFSFQQGVDGYEGTVDIFTRDADVWGTNTAPESTVDGSTIATGFIDGDAGSAADRGANARGIFRFEGIVGEEAIASGSTVARAYFVLTTNSSSNSQTNGPVAIHAMRQGWNTSTLLSEFAEEGPTVDNGVLGPELDRATSVGAYGEAWFDVTAAVQEWVDGEENHGLYVEDLSGDGWNVFFTGAPLATARPRLVVITAPDGTDVTPQTVSFQNGVDEYAGNIDRVISDLAANNRDGAAVRQYFLDGARAETPTVSFSEDAQGLMRFENIIGPNPGQVPEGATVLRAELDITTATQSNNAPSNGSFHVARLLEPFSTASSNPDPGEWNVDLAYAFFPFSEGWIGGIALNESNNGQLTTLIGSPGLTIGDETSFANFIDYTAPVPSTNQGYYQLFLDGVDSTTDGILLVGGGKKEGNFALSKPISGFESGWEIVCHDNRVNASSGENDPVAFVYVPLTAVAEGRAKALGRIMGDGSVAIGAGDFSLERLGTGTYRLTIPGASDASGTLVISPEGRGRRETMDEFGSPVFQNLLNVDNIVNYEWDGIGWVVETRDLPGATLQELNPDEGFFNFAFFEYAGVPSLPAYETWAATRGFEPGQDGPLLDPDGDGLPNFAEFALGTNPLVADGAEAAPVSLVDAEGGERLEIRFKRRTDVDGLVSYIVEFSDDLATWEPSETATETLGPELEGDYREVRISDATEGTPRRFARVRLNYTP